MGMRLAQFIAYTILLCTQVPHPMQPSLTRTWVISLKKPHPQRYLSQPLVRLWVLITLTQAVATTFFVTPIHAKGTASLCSCSYQPHSQAWERGYSDYTTASNPLRRALGVRTSGA